MCWQAVCRAVMHPGVTNSMRTHHQRFHLPAWPGHSPGGTGKTPINQISLGSWFVASIPWELSQGKKALWIAGEQAHCSGQGKEPFTAKVRRIVAGIQLQSCFSADHSSSHLP